MWMISQVRLLRKVADMVTVRISDQAGERLAQDGGYSDLGSEFDATLDRLEEDPELDTWMTEVIGPRLEARAADPDNSLTGDQVLTQLFG
jgi:hypothetical protein